jgi:hypothetical protein
MAERLVLLLATQVARVRFPVPARSTFRVEKVALFCNPASGGTFASTAIEIMKWVKKFAVAQAKVSHIFRPRNTAFKEQLKLVNGFERKYQRIHALKKIAERRGERVKERVFIQQRELGLDGLLN